MSILRHEVVPWSDNIYTNLGISRTAVEMHVIGGMVTFAAHMFSTMGVSEAKSAIRDVIASLPDDDIAELNYAATEMDHFELVVMFEAKARNIEALRVLVDETGPEDTEEN